MALPTNIDSTYSDASAADALHQQYHDTLHGQFNDYEGTVPADFAADDHDHDSDYSATTHDHDSDYAALAHDHDIDDINATGTADSSTFLRGDGTWSAPDVDPLVTVESEAGTSYTVVAGDHGKVKRFTAASLVTVTLPDALSTGTLVNLLFVGTAGGAVQDDGSSTVNGEGTVAQHGEASCLVTTTDTWHVAGTA